MLGSAVGFSVMSLFVKLAGERLPSQELVLARAAVTLVLSWAMLKRAGVSPWGTRRGLLLLRGLLGFCGLSCFYYAVTALPLAEATVIQYTHPVFTTLLAFFVLKEAISSRLVWSLILGFTGVVLVTRPDVTGLSGGLDPFAAGVALLGALFAAAAYVIVRKLSKTEHTHVIIFYFPLIAVPLSIPPLIPVAVWPTPLEWLLLLLVGVSTQVGQVCLTRGLKLMPAGQATAVSYMQIVFAAAIGIGFFDELPSAWTWAGSALILVGTLLAGRKSSK